ncbi:hypothetical protein FEDK69T_16130 [Flavobacterium enshiense DK69]|uniref:Uncharacterized protein n=1 Tax=Flavobacterium enshiense DK69 TaxID=1107311 RepID=V6SB23_9FLAO|nr:hypothetical protein [Flavobacterium enshiense]ESU23447.1 hypothetical protein FEDK69T_16130 [Flavobacterium enshiense DK69]KGO96331.1 hypothetical protein Q767_05300 [Flavobacterium enshiense DK69]
MKKIITLFVLFFAFSINASAQDKSIEFKKSAKKDLELLLSVIPIEGNMQNAIYNLFVKKHKDLNAPDMTPAKRSQITHTVDAKMKASLTNDQITALEKNKEIYAQLIGSETAATTTVKEKK